MMEIKDQDGPVGPRVGPLKEAAATVLRCYEGPLAVMSFNPHPIAAMAELAPDLPRGFTTAAIRPEDWRGLTPETCVRLRDMPDYDQVDACFISHKFTDLSWPRVLEIKAQGAALLYWAITSAAAEREARSVADNVTFEGYLA